MFHLNDNSTGSSAYFFAKLMFDVKIKSALRGKCLHLNDAMEANRTTTVQDILESKHPPTASQHPECLNTNTDSSLSYYPVIFDALDGSVICAAALCTLGAAGPSGVDAYGW